MLQDRSFLTGHKLVINAKIQNESVSRQINFDRTKMQKFKMRHFFVICGQTVLPDRSVLKGHKWIERKCDILSNFQTM